MQEKRRSVIKKLFASVTAVAALGFTAKAKAIVDEKKEVGDITNFQDTPMFSAFTRHGDLVYVSGQGAHVEPFEIKAHTEIVLKDLENVLIKAGSSMTKVLKVNVYLSDMADFPGMNEIYKGRFGDKPPVRTTVAVAKGGVPGNSLVEMDCIAYV